MITENTRYNAENICRGIFSLRTRKFDKTVDILINVFVSSDWGTNLPNDKAKPFASLSVEIRFIKALKSINSTITEHNILEQIVSADDNVRMFKSTEWKENSFDCNIQQVKKKEFEVLYYGIFFSDKVVIFKINSAQIGKEIQYSDKQHRGNKGEGQFHLNNRTYEYHLNHYKEKELTYEEILDLLLKLKTPLQVR